MEAIGGGDWSRSSHPLTPSGESGAFISVNRNKKSVALELRSDAGRALARRLADTASVVVENFRPGVAARLGVGYADFAESNPALVYCSISGFGQTGPRAGQGGFDLIAQGLTGLMSVTGTRDGEPVKCGIPVTDLGAGLLALSGILAAVLERERSGRGQLVETSLFDAGLGLAVWETTEYFFTGSTPRPTGSAHRLGAPYQAYRGRDGHFTVGGDSTRLWPLFCQVLGRPELAVDERFATSPGRVENVDALTEIVEAVTVSRPVAEWIQAFEDAGIPCGPINSIPAAVADPQTVARRLVAEVEHPTAGRVRSIGPVVHFSRTPASVRTPAPLLGEHTAEVLAGIGVEPDEYERLRAEGVVA